jgi:hypothetical protein
VRAAHLSPPATGIFFISVGKAWWQLIAILLTFVIVMTAVVVLAALLAQVL